MKIYFTDRSMADVQNFIRAMEEAFVELFRDSGIWAEDMIVQSYLATASELKKILFEEIKKRLQRGKVLGRKNLGLWKELAFHIGSRLIVVYYSDNIKRKIRIVESIGIDRKPLIF